MLNEILYKLDMTDPLTRKITISLIVTVAGMTLYQIAFFITRRLTAKKEAFLPKLLQKKIFWPGFILISLVILQIVWHLIQKYIDEKLFAGVKQLLFILIIGTCAFLLIKIFAVLSDFLIKKISRKEPIDYSLRKARTKFQLINRILNILVTIGAVAGILMTFDQVREVGNTLLASAGLVGIILGFAAQKSLGTLFSGIQIALAQPIKIDDTVVVEGEFGKIGEINLTYVIINSWDGRRIVVPINFFLEKPFENWTRSSAEVVGKVKIYTDYTLPVDDVRKAFIEWVKDSPLWDKRSCSLLVTDASESTIEIRAAMSAKDSDDAYDLECLIREKLIAFIQENYPETLPRTRISVDPAKLIESKT
jgi:small-conductance mechanosensitive channel